MDKPGYDVEVTLFAEGAIIDFSKKSEYIALYSTDTKIEDMENGAVPLFEIKRK